jgi:hypothetical protein
MSHWYDKDGKAAYTQLLKSGKERPTTLRDARKQTLVPSVTTVLGVEAAPALVNYKINQVLEAVLNHPINNLLSVDEWKKDIIIKSGEHAKNAARRGSELHDALEEYYTYKIMPDHWDFIEPVVEFLEERFPKAEWEAEKSFCDPLGFGGKVDLHCPCGIVLDFKTKDTDDLKKMRAYDSHHMQTAAYAAGLGMPNAKRYNLFISTRQPGLLKLTESKNMERDWAMFKSLLDFWKLKNNYDPSEELNV